MSNQQIMNQRAISKNNRQYDSYKRLSLEMSLFYDLSFENISHFISNYWTESTT